MLVLIKIMMLILLFSSEMSLNPATEDQQQAIAQARQLLQAAGLDISTLKGLATSARPDREPTQDLSHTDHLSTRFPHPAVAGYRYVSSPLEVHSADVSWCPKINRQTTISALVDHPLNAIVEYPATGQSAEQLVAHRFTVNPGDPNDRPHLNFQYSLGGNSRGGYGDAYCGSLLVDSEHQPVPCRYHKRSCK